jgi:DNA (cytosine-5)-methyltransferase 1
VRLDRLSGEPLARQLKEAYAEGLERRPGDLEPIRLVYLQSHSRTRKWFKDGEQFVWSDGETNCHANYAPPKTLRRTRSRLAK